MNSDAYVNAIESFIRGSKKLDYQASASFEGNDGWYIRLHYKNTKTCIATFNGYRQIIISQNLNDLLINRPELDLIKGFLNSLYLPQDVYAKH